MSGSRRYDRQGLASAEKRFNHAGNQNQDFPRPQVSSMLDRVLVAAVAAYVCLIPFEVSAAIQGYSFTALAGMTVVAAWVLRWLLQDKSRSCDRRIDWRTTSPIWQSVTVFLVLVIVSYIFSTPHDANATEKLRTMVSVTVLLPALTTAFLISGTLIIRLFLVPATLLSLRTLLDLDGTGQVAAFGLNENGQGYLLSVATVWAIWFALSLSGSTNRVVYATAAIACLIGTLGSGSRTGAITAMIAIPVGLLVAQTKVSQQSRRRAATATWSLLVSAGLLMSWFIVRPLLPVRLSGLGDSFGSGQTWGGRRDLWDAAFSQTQEWLITGMGLGQSELLTQSVLGLPSVLHNTFLSVAVELGIVGLASFMMVGYSTLKVGRLGANAGPVMVAIAPTVLFMMTLSMEYYKMLWLMPAIAAGGCWNTRGLTQSARGPSAKKGE